MQYKKTTKIVIDKTKLDILIRLGCPCDKILSLITTGKFEKTGDILVDEILESLCDFRSFNNWGGARKNSGRKSNQLENQLENQDGGQVADKEIEEDIKETRIKEKDIKGKPLKEEENQFNEFWKLYTPVQCSDGKHTERGSRKTAFEAFKRALKKDSYENIKDGLKRYLAKKAKNNSLTAHVSTFLNQECWKDNESEELILAAPDKKTHPEKSNYQKTMEMVERMKREDWNKC